MQHKVLQDGKARTIMLVFEEGEEAKEGIEQFAAEQDLQAAHFTAIGALSGATLAFYDPETKDYDEIPVGEQVEVLTMAGNIARHEGEPVVHAHMTAGRRDGSTIGGHVMEAHVRPTLEVIVKETPSTLHREMDEATQLTLLQMAKG